MYEMEFRELENGDLHSFSSWPNLTVPSSAGVYTIWDADGRFIYVGMSGRGRTKEQVQEMRSGRKSKGLRERLNAHASGRRSGDQFCVYVADRLVLPSLDGEAIRQIGDGELSLDGLTRDYIRSRLFYRFIETEDGNMALTIESAIKQGKMAAGMPLLNPG